MARTYREIAIQEMLRTVEEAMSQAINWWGDLPPPMKEAIEQFRTQLGAAIDSVEFVKRALDCESACKKDPLFGVIGFQSGPRNRGSTLASMILGSRGWGAGRGDDCKDPPRVF